MHVTTLSPKWVQKEQCIRVKEITLQEKPGIMIAKSLFTDSIREYSELEEGTHKDHRTQLLSEWPVQHLKAAHTQAFI